MQFIQRESQKKKKNHRMGSVGKDPSGSWSPRPKKIPTLCLRVLFGCSLKFYSVSNPLVGEDFCDFPPQPSPAQLPPISYVYLYISIYKYIYINPQITFKIPVLGLGVLF